CVLYEHSVASANSFNSWAPNDAHGFKGDNSGVSSSSRRVRHLGSWPLRTATVMAGAVTFTRMGRVLHVSLLMFSCLISGVVTAQGGLNDAAASALKSGQAAAAEAIATYERHFPDQPLWQEAIAQGEKAKE